MWSQASSILPLTAFSNAMLYLCRPPPPPPPLDMRHTITKLLDLLALNLNHCNVSMKCMSSVDEENTFAELKNAATHLKRDQLQPEIALCGSPGNGTACLQCCNSNACIGLHQCIIATACASTTYVHNTSHLTWHMTVAEWCRLPMCHQNCLRFYNDIAYDLEYNGAVNSSAEGERLSNVLGTCSTLFHRSHGTFLVGPSIAQVRKYISNAW